MGHYASEMGYGPGEYEQKQNERLERMRKILSRMPMSRFTADYIYDINMVMAPNVKYRFYRDTPLDRLEALLAVEVKLFKKGR